jgi:hypothetical protein
MFPFHGRMRDAWKNAQDLHRMQTGRGYEDRGGFRDVITACMKRWEPGVSHVHTLQQVDRIVLWLCRMVPSLYLLSPQEFLDAIQCPSPPCSVAPVAAAFDLAHWPLFPEGPRPETPSSLLLREWGEVAEPSSEMALWGSDWEPGGGSAPARSEFCDVEQLKQLAEQKYQVQVEVVALDESLVSAGVGVGEGVAWGHKTLGDGSRLYRYRDRKSHLLFQEITREDHTWTSWQVLADLVDSNATVLGFRTDGTWT